MKKLWATIKNTWLCVKYPFLYPRNRWTDKHYNSWKILNFITENYDKSHAKIYFKVYGENSDPGQTSNYRFLDQETNEYLRTEYQGDTIRIIYGVRKSRIERELYKAKLGSEIIFSGWLRGKESTLIVRVKEFKELNEEWKNSFKFINATTHPGLALLVKILRDLENSLLQIIHFPTSYTELDSLESGWGVAFGERLCKDLKDAIIISGGYKALFKFRILQIKEKFGKLEIYYAGYSKEVNKVISKYSKLSEEICIKCGKPATYISKGWISPYCDDCIPDKTDAVKKEKKD